MRLLRPVSVLLFFGGMLLLAGSLLLSLSPTWTLTGLLLAWAGLIKVVVVHLWRGIAPPARANDGLHDD